MISKISNLKYLKYIIKIKKFGSLNSMISHIYLSQYNMLLIMCYCTIYYLA